MFIVAGDPNEIRRRQEEERMQSEAFLHDLERLLAEELTEEQLRVLGDLFRMVSFHPEPKVALAYYDGLIRGVLKDKFGVCITHNRTHGIDEVLGGTPEEPSAESGTSDSERVPKLMDEYGVHPSTAELPWTLDTPVICTNCKMQYVSLRDRMLKPPGLEHCSGCVQKTKFG